MKTVFRKGMIVYDQVFFGENLLKIIEVKSDMTLRVLYGEVTFCYTGDGRFIGEDITSNRNRGLSHNPTLSTKPYKIVGFEQKEPAKTYEEALEWLKENSKDIVIYADEAYINESYELAFETLKKLIILRDYYNEGWQPDWKSTEELKYYIKKYIDEFLIKNTHIFIYPLFFKSEKIALKFLEGQRELLEIAKPLL